MKSSMLLTALGGASTALAATRGFNYASQGQTQASFESQFKIAASLKGADNYNGARLYTMIQDGTATTPISAIQAAIDTKTTLLLGLWASQDQNGFNNELSALKAAINTYGSQFADLVTGISVGSEDLYRISPTGIANHEGIGQSPDVLVTYISQVRDTIRGTVLGSKPVGHVDTWNVYVNGSNSKVIAAADFLGLDEYPYYETTNANSIDNAKSLFFSAYDKVAAVSQGKPIWITESGWPTSGPVSGQAVASVDNAETYWQAVACELERRNVNTWWYILADAGASPSFGVSNNGQPLYDLSCKAVSSSSSSSSSATASASSTSSSAAGSSPTGSSSGPSSASGSSPTTVVSTSGSSAIATSTGTAAVPVGTTTVSPSGEQTVSPSTGMTTSRTSTTAATTPTAFQGAAPRIGNSLAGLIACAVIAGLFL